MAGSNSLWINLSGRKRNGDNQKLLQLFQQHVKSMINALPMIFTYMWTYVFSRFLNAKMKQVADSEKCLNVARYQQQTSKLSSNFLSKFNNCWDSSLSNVQSSLYQSSSHWKTCTLSKVRWPELISTLVGERLMKKPGYFNKILVCLQSFINGFVNPEAGKIFFHFSG